MAVRLELVDAVLAGIEQVLAQGFTRHAVDLAAKLSAEGLDWVGQAVVIGERRKSWRRGVIADLVEEVLPIDLIPGLRRTVAPTLVVVAARPLPDGADELLVMPMPRALGDPEPAFGAAPRVRRCRRRACCRRCARPACSSRWIADLSRTSPTQGAPPRGRPPSCSLAGNSRYILRGHQGNGACMAVDSFLWQQ